MWTSWCKKQKVRDDLMDTRKIAETKLFGAIDNLDDLLEQVLPRTDKKHREEIFDILSLVRYRTEQYLREYGVSEDACSVEEEDL